MFKSLNHQQKFHDDLDGLPSTNLDAERHLFVFGKRSPVAKFINKNVTTKGIRNDVTLFQSATFKSEISKRFLSIVKLLNDLEKDWVDKQKQFHQLKILEKIKKEISQKNEKDQQLVLKNSFNPELVS